MHCSSCNDWYWVRCSENQWGYEGNSSNVKCSIHNLLLTRMKFVASLVFLLRLEALVGFLLKCALAR
uniref:Uncharacterized protein n=1 Tax=Arundo donax TaxID=35708 RepID=A0A0A9DG71_ARUDO